MTWKNKKYPINTYKADIPREEICHNCGRDQFSHGRYIHDEDSAPFFICQEELLPLKRDELRVDVHDLDDRFPLPDKEISTILRGLLARSEAIEDLVRNIKFQPARKVPED
jgi:hypothetical protein